MAYITLNKKKFFHNLDIIVQKTKTKEKVAIVLKDNAYGHGIVEIASLAKEYGITKCVVQTTQEALKIKDFFQYILVLADFPQEQHKNIVYTINDINTIKNFPKNTRVELKVDTGMHRNGVIDLKSAFQKIKQQELLLEGVFTHHKNADALTSEWFWQNDIFKNIKKEAKILAKKYQFSSLRFHSANSASLFRYENFNEDLARVGIAVYGCLELAKGLPQPNLQPILSLYASQISSRLLKKGQRIGYGGVYEASKDIMISTYDIGYGDGFLRILSNTFQTPNQEKLIGRISMDNSSFISKKKELLIFNDATKVAKMANTISYEVLTSLKPNIPRHII